MSAATALPTLHPPAGADFPAVRIKASPDDFMVEELPLYEPSGSGTHLYFWIEKRGINTMDAVRRLAAVLRKRAADAGVAGLKDSRAVSRQWISFEHVKENFEQARQFSDEKIVVLKAAQHGNKLKMGHLRGNRFAIRLVPASGANSAACERIAARCREVFATLQQKGIPNYYGEQRFGRNGENVRLGRMLVQGDLAGFEKAFAELNHGRKADRRLKNLIVNALQSDLFNQVLAARMPEIGKLLAGDLAWLHRNGAVFAVANDADAAKEQPRADAFEISPSGPIYGGKSKLAEGRPGEIERQILAQSGLKLEDFGRREAERQPGARRSLRIAFLETPAVELETGGVVVRFALPSGAYATVVLREILGDSANDTDV